MNFMIEMVSGRIFERCLGISRTRLLRMKGRPFAYQHPLHTASSDLLSKQTEEKFASR